MFVSYLEKFHISYFGYILEDEAVIIEINNFTKQFYLLQIVYINSFINYKLI